MAKEIALDQRERDAANPAAERLSPAAELLEVRDLAVDYRIRGDVVHAVRSASVHVAPGEMVALVGESGSGKSTTAHAVLGLLAPTARVVGGRVELAGEELTRLRAERMRRLRGRTVALIPQDPGTSLNPVVRVGDQVAESLVVHGLADRRRARAAAPDILARAGIADPRLRARQFPHELSGGLRQRVLIAIALAASPRLIVADEPTSALDVVVAHQILDHLQTLTRDAGIGVLLVTHDLAVAARRCARIVVMAGGEVVEDAAAAEVIAAPKHPATQALVAATASRHPFRRPAAVPRPRTPPGSDDARTAAHVRIERLVKEYRLPRTADGDGDGDGVVCAVDDVSFDIAGGQTFALVGASGSGKSTLARMLLRFTAPTSGRLFLDGRDITAVRGGELRRLRQRMQLVHQNPFASLNPRLTVEQIVADPLAAFGLGTRRDRRARAAELVDLVALPADTLARRPAELSGGQRQRVAIARALAPYPGLVVCDEPVSALDATVQAQILDLLVRLQEELGLSYLFISHDLAVVRRIAHRVGVLQRGRLVEDGPAEQVLTAPRHSYTQELVAAADSDHQPA